METCPQCRGFGMIYADNAWDRRRCTRCDGLGRIYSAEADPLTITADAMRRGAFEAFEKEHHAETALVEHPHDAAAQAHVEAAPKKIRFSERDISHLPTDAARRKDIPLATGVLDYFPRALAAVAEVSRMGNEQHNPGQPLHWAKGKSTDHADCAIRHFIERGTRDTDGGRHSAKAAWRVLAYLEMEILAEEAGLPFDEYIRQLKEAA